MDEPDFGTKATVTDSVARFYDSYGWVKQGDGKVGEDQEPLRGSAEVDRVDGQALDAREKVGGYARQRAGFVVGDHPHFLLIFLPVTGCVSLG